MATRRHHRPTAHTRGDRPYVSTPCAAPAAPAAPADLALVARRSPRRPRRTRLFIDMSRTHGGRNGHGTSQRCLCGPALWRPEFDDGSTGTLSTSWKLERATNSTSRQEDFAVTRRHDMAQRAHHAGLQRPVLQCGDDQEAWCANGSTQRGSSRTSTASALEQQASPPRAWKSSTVLSSSTPTRTGCSSSCAC